MNTLDALFAAALIGLGCLMQGCAFGGYVDWVQEGSKLEASYGKDRYYRAQSGMAYAQKTVKPKQEAEEEEQQPEIKAADVSPRKGWSWVK